MGRDALTQSELAVRAMLSKAKYRAKQKGVTFSLKPEDIFIPSHCPVSGLALSRGSGRASDASPSLDRIVPELGYVKGNVIVVSNRVNMIKNSSNPNELRKIAAFYDWLIQDRKLKKSIG